MGATGTMEPKVIFGAEEFITNAARYKNSRALVDALVKVDEDKREGAIAEALDVVDALKVQSDNGAQYTPPTDWGFGSENGAGIANVILGLRKGASTIRGLFAKKGA